MKIPSNPKVLVISLFIAALIFSTGLAWNDFVQNLIKHYSKADEDSLKGSIIYVVIVTILLMVIGLTASKHFPKALENAS